MPTVFQFLMVRLKGELGGLIEKEENLFQFLMVRLKVGELRSQQAAGLFQFLMVRLKEEEADPDLFNGDTFQFLMVRLKGRIGGFYSGNRMISIPYGSIKSQYHYCQQR